MKINLGEFGGGGEGAGHNILGLILAIIVTGVCTFACIMFANILEQEVNQAKKQVQEIEAKISKDASLKSKMNVYKTQMNELNEKNKAISILEAKQVGPVFLFSELSDLISNRIYFTNMDFLGTDLNISGRAIDNIVLADFLTRLMDSRYFSEVVLIETKHGVEENIDLMSFNIKGSVRLPKYE